MSPVYEERLQHDLERIRSEVAEVGQRVEKALRDALRAVLDLDKPLANATILGDLSINRAIRRIDRLCHYFIARHLPSAGHLRFISSVLRLNIGLERVGDYAVTLAREAKALSGPLEDDVRREVELMADEAFQMFHQAVQAFDERNPDTARATMGYADQVDHTFADAFDMLLQKGRQTGHPIKDLFSTFVIFHRIERVSDQAKNICEETVFAVTGETKKPKRYRILFLEEADDCRSQMAVAIARKSYPESGEYASAGLHPANRLDPACVRFMEEHGHDLSDRAPRGFERIPEYWKEKHVVVSLSGPVERFIEDVPFHTITLEWDVPPPPPGGDEEAVRAAFEDLYQRLAAEISGLMETLHGPEVS